MPLRLSGTTGVSAIDGSAGTPAIQGVDTDTGLYFPAANEVAISTNGSGRLFVNSSGSVGIGSSSPVFLTDILSGTANTGANVNNPSQLSVTGPNKSLTAGGATVFINSNSDLAIDTGGSIALSGRNTTSSTNSVVWGVIKGAKENATSTNTAGYLAFASANHSAGGLVEAMRIDSSQRVGIGTTSPGSILHLQQSASAAVGPDLRLTNNAGTASDKARISFFGGSVSPTIRGALDFNINATGVGELIWSSGEGSVTERLRCDASGRFLVGTSTSRNVGLGTSYPSTLQLETTNYAAASFVNNSNDVQPAYLTLGKSRGGIGSNTIVQSGDVIGHIGFAGADGTDIETLAAHIQCAVDGTPGANDMPGRLVFSTTADGASSPTERMRITNAGNVYIGSTAYDYRFTVQNEASNSRTAYIRANAGSFTDDVLVLDTGTAAGTGFNLLRAYSNAVAQFRVRGDGTIYAQNTTVQSISDARVKENITESTDGLNVITGLRPVRFDFKEGFGNNRKNQLGFIAQEVEAVFPDAVDVASESADDGEDPYKSVGPGAFIPVLVKAIQEQQAMIAELQAEVAALKAA